jgi:hypothetical protein
MGRPREILKPREGEKILVHRSVKTRMEAGDSELEGGIYLPKAMPTPSLQDVEWVD